MGHGEERALELRITWERKGPEIRLLPEERATGLWVTWE
jgi:hypothetical protein